MQLVPTSADAQLQWLVDRAAITDVLTAMPNRANAKAFDSIRELFTEDGVIEVPYATIPAAEIPERVGRIIGAFDATHHMVSNIEIEIDGDDARSHHYLHAVHIPDAEHPDQHADYGAIYDNEYRRTPGGWKLSRVHLRIVFTDGLPFEPEH
jgi:SnoaL-like domain